LHDGHVISALILELEIKYKFSNKKNNERKITPPFCFTDNYSWPAKIYVCGKRCKK